MFVPEVIDEAINHYKSLTASRKEVNRLEAQITNIIYEKSRLIASDLNKQINTFASECSIECQVPDDDNGPFDSLFCSRVEEIIVKKLEAYIYIRAKRG